MNRVQVERAEATGTRSYIVSHRDKETYYVCASSNLTLFNADERKGLWGEVLGMTVGSPEVNLLRERAEVRKFYARVGCVLCQI